MDKLIVKASISPMPQQLGDPMPEVTVQYSDGDFENLFWYYPDELSFSPDEFVGLSRDEAFELKGRKQREYLQAELRGGEMWS